MEDKIIAYIKEHYNVGEFQSSYDFNYELPASIISKILEAKTRDQALDYLNELIDIDDRPNSYDDGYVTQVVSDIERDIKGIEDGSDYSSLIAVTLSDEGIYVDDSLSSMLDMEVKLDVYPSINGAIPMLGGLKESIYDFSETLSESGITTDYSSALSQIMETLRLNPIAVQKALLKNNNFPENADTSWPDIQYSYGSLISESEFVEEMENASYGGCLVFTCNINLSEYIKNSEHYHSNGMVIPEGTSLGIHDWMNGSGGFIGCVLKEDLLLTDFELMTDNNHRYGYGLDEIMGLVSSVWTDNKVSHNISFDDKKLIGDMQDLIAYIDEIKHDVKYLNLIVHAARNVIEMASQPPFDDNFEKYLECIPDVTKYHNYKQKGYSQDYFNDFFDKVLFSGSIDGASTWIREQCYSDPTFKSEFEKKIELLYKTMSSSASMEKMIYAVYKIDGGLDQWKKFKSNQEDLITGCSDIRYDYEDALDKIHSVFDEFDSIVDSTQKIEPNLSMFDFGEIMLDRISKASSFVETSFILNKDSLNLINENGDPEPGIRIDLDM